MHTSMCCKVQVGKINKVTQEQIRFKGIFAIKPTIVTTYKRLVTPKLR
jgi:hypothetical protein